MKKLLFILCTLFLFCACGKKKSDEPKQFIGFISDASMNTVTVKALVSDSVITFSTMDADKSEAYGMLIGSPVIVNYKNNPEGTAEAIKVKTDETYSKAIGEWTMPDPNFPDSAVMGIDIKVKGEASSINMATLVYKSWELQGEANKLILNGESIGSGQTFDFKENAIISEKDGKLYLSIEGTDVVYTKKLN